MIQGAELNTRREIPYLHYSLHPLDKYYQNLLSFLVDSDLANEWWYPPFEQLLPVKQIFQQGYFYF